MNKKACDKMAQVTRPGDASTKTIIPPLNIIERARNASNEDNKMLVNLLGTLARGEEQKLREALDTIARTAMIKNEATKNLRLIDEELARIKRLPIGTQNRITMPT